MDNWVNRWPRIFKKVRCHWYTSQDSQCSAQSTSVSSQKTDCSFALISQHDRPKWGNTLQVSLLLHLLISQHLSKRSTLFTSRRMNCPASPKPRKKLQCQWVCPRVRRAATCSATNSQTRSPQYIWRLFIRSPVLVANSMTFTALGSVGYQKHDGAISVPQSGDAFVGTRNENIEFSECQFLSVFFTECQRKQFRRPLEYLGIRVIPTAIPV